MKAATEADTNNQDLALARWRLVLGRFADKCLGGGMGGSSRYQHMDRMLDFVYGREYGGRTVRPDGEGRHGGSEESHLTIPEWVKGVHDLFPSETVEVLQRHALDRYQMTELVTEPEVLRKMEPSYELLKSVLAFKGLMGAEVLEVARQLIRHVVEELQRKLTPEVRRVLWGRLNRQQRTRLPGAGDLDWVRTLRGNLKHYDKEKRRLIALENRVFFTRTKHHIPWHVIIAVDCSGSMLDSVIHTAVMAGIFSGLPSLRVSLVAFDTSVVDLTDQVSDPVEVLMSVQLGGGTDIAGALCYCETLLQNPHRTILVLVTDFFEGGPAQALLAAIVRLREAGVRVLGLAALDQEAQPTYDKEMAQRCADAGADVAALTPRRLAEWVEQVIS